MELNLKQLFQFQLQYLQDLTFMLLAILIAEVLMPKNQLFQAQHQYLIDLIQQTFQLK